MNGGLDVLDVLRQSNPVPTSSIDERTVATSAQRWAALEESQTTVPLTSPSRETSQDHWRWQRYALVAAALVVVAIGFVLFPSGDDSAPANPTETTAPDAPTTVPATTVPTTTPAPPPALVGVWRSIDTDNSNQVMEIVWIDEDERQVTIHDDAATDACLGSSSTMTGVATITSGGSLSLTEPMLTCDDGSEPTLGPPPQAALVGYSFTHDSATDELIDVSGVRWWRDGATPSVESRGGIGEARTAIQALLDAAVLAMDGDTAGPAQLLDLFAEGATINSVRPPAQTIPADADSLDAWVAQLRTWGFNGELGECWTDVDIVAPTCPVRVRWDALSAEEDQYWSLTISGDRIQSLRINSSEIRYGDPTSALSVSELDRWEEWLSQTDPATAARLIPAESPTSSFPIGPRYDPALADEISASIEQYIAQQPAGDTITVTPDGVVFGDRLVGLIGNMDRVDGRTYVIAGRYETEADLLSAPENAVLAAFDEAGVEQWRTELAGRPARILVVGDDLWVRHLGDGSLSRIDSQSGQVLGRLSLEKGWDVFKGFGNLWALVADETGSRPEQLVRIDPDLSMTAVDIPLIGSANNDGVGLGDVAVGPTSILVSLGSGGLAIVDPTTLEVTTIPAEEVGHNVYRVAFDETIVYAASDDEVTSIVDGQVVATTSLADIWGFGHVDGEFGALTANGFAVLAPDAPMRGNLRAVSPKAGGREIDGNLWTEEGENYNLRRLEFVGS